MSASDLRRLLSAFLAALLYGLALIPASAQQASREQEQVRRLRLQVQQLQQNQATERDNAQRAAAATTTATRARDVAAAERDTARAQLRRARSAIADEEARYASLQQTLDAQMRAATVLQTRLEQQQAQLTAGTKRAEELRAGTLTLQQGLQTREAAMIDLQTRHIRQGDGLRICIANNQALRDVGHELLQRYANKTVADVLAQNEPFLQFQRVKLENLLQDYQEKLDQKAVQPHAVNSTARPVGDSRSTSRAP